MTFQRIVLALVFVFSLGLFAQAQTATPKVSKRQKVQKERIKDGVQSGELTKRETAKVARQQRDIKRTKRRAKADGNVTTAERARIHSKQNKANRNIRRKKNNDRSRN